MRRGLHRRPSRKGVGSAVCAALNLPSAGAGSEQSLQSTDPTLPQAEMIGQPLHCPTSRVAPLCCVARRYANKPHETPLLTMCAQVHACSLDSGPHATESTRSGLQMCSGNPCETKGPAAGSCDLTTCPTLSCCGYRQQALRRPGPPARLLGRQLLHAWL